MEGKEILAVVDSVSSEKGLEKDVIFVAMELAIASASQRHFHEDAQLIVEVDRGSGEFITKRQWEVLDENDEEFHRESYISPSESSMEIGELYFEQVDNVEFGRIETQAARQVMLQKVREAEKELIVSKFRSSDNNLVSGFVKRVTRDNIIVDLGQDAEAILPRDQILPGEIFKINDRVRAVLQIKEIEGRGLQLMLSRICSEMVTELFRIEVPEVNEDVIEIRGVARDPGSRSKIAVKTNDGRIDPVGACVGMRGSRVQAVSNEIGNERIDIFIHSENPAEFVVNCLAPIKIFSILVDDRTSTLILEVEEENQAQIIGKNGQNLRLMTQMIGWSFQVLNKEQFAEYQNSSLIEKFDQVAERLGLADAEKEQMMAFEMDTLEKVVDADADTLSKIFKTQKRASEVTDKANELLLQDAFNDDFSDPTMEDALVSLNGITNDVLSALSSNNLKKLDDLAEMSVGELMEICDKVTEKEASALIMEARKPWFN